MRHSCDVGEEDMEYMVRATGAYGEEAREMLKTFIREEQDKHWRYVEDEDPCPVLNLWLSNQIHRQEDPGPGRRETYPLYLWENLNQSHWKNHQRR